MSLVSDTMQSWVAICMHLAELLCPSSTGLALPDCVYVPLRLDVERELVPDRERDDAVDLLLLPVVLLAPLFVLASDSFSASSLSAEEVLALPA